MESKMRTRILSPVLLIGTLAAAAIPADLRAERFECLVEPYLKVNLSSGIPGILDEVRVDRGDFVEKGQVLATRKLSTRKTIKTFISPLWSRIERLRKESANFPDIVLSLVYIHIRPSSV